MKSVVRRALLRVARLLGIPEIQQRLDSVEYRLIETDAPNTAQRFTVMERYLEHRFAQSMTDHIETVRDQLAACDQQFSDLSKRIDAQEQGSLRHAELITSEMRDYLEKEINTTKRNLDNLRRAYGSSAPANEYPSGSINNGVPIIDDSLYLSLEDHFRGEKSIVYQRQIEYLPYVREIVTEQHPLLDLGCGRGEWLTVLKEHGFSARGVDSNQSCVAECRENGLDVVSGNLLTTLQRLPDVSCGAITMFQVLEHLPFGEIVEVLREARRVLIDGGVFIGEIPNSETLRVGASTFWIDPTHQRPLFPGVLVFLASTVGFSGVEGKYSSPLAPAPDLDGVPENVAKAILDLHLAINGPGDFALIASA